MHLDCRGCTQKHNGSHWGILFFKATIQPSRNERKNKSNSERTEIKKREKERRKDASTKSPYLLSRVDAPFSLHWMTEIVLAGKTKTKKTVNLTIRILKWPLWITLTCLRLRADFIAFSREREGQEESDINRDVCSKSLINRTFTTYCCQKG